MSCMIGASQSSRNTTQTRSPRPSGAATIRSRTTTLLTSHSWSSGSSLNSRYCTQPMVYTVLILGIFCPQMPYDIFLVSFHIFSFILSFSLWSRSCRHGRSVVLNRRQRLQLSWEPSKKPWTQETERRKNQLNSSSNLPPSHKIMINRKPDL